MPDCEVGVCVTARGESLLLRRYGSKLRRVCPTVWRRRVQLGSQPRSIELSLGVGDIQDCFHRYVLDDEFASYFRVNTVFARELSLSGSCLDGVLLDDHSKVDFLWCCLPMEFSWSLFFVQLTNEKIMSSCVGPRGIPPHHE